ncbi:MAG: TIR domain-containing protein [Opitutaceae bacterium]|nr:TIR domain-containing protein [Opitutaceae bacterium]
MSPSNRLSVERSGGGRAVFLSYAREDAAAARRIAEALRAAGVEVWFDESELRGGDSWDSNIRKQIKECALFVPIISANTQARLEGYFRLEWRLADRRTELIGKSKAFLVPVCIDDTREAHADVPDSFCAVQWTRLPLRQAQGSEQPGGEASAAFCTRVKALLDGQVGSRPPSSASDTERPRAAAVPSERHPWRIVAAATLIAGVAFALWQPWKKAGAPVAGSSKSGAIAPLSEARALAAKADALFDQDEAPPRENLNLAEQFCKQAIAVDPNDAEIWAIFSRVGSYFVFRTFDRSKERIAQAGDAANRAIRLAPDSFEARYALAYFYRLDDATYPEAERMLRSLLEERPADKRVWRALGYTLRAGTVFSARSRGRVEESLECFRRAAALPGGDPLALQYESAALAQLGRMDEAEKAVDAAIRLKPRGSAPISKANQLLRYRGDVARAREALAKVPVEYLREDYAAFIASQTWWCSREPDKEIDALKAMPRDYLEAVFDGPKGFLMGQAHRLAGRSQAAAVEWRAALQLIEGRLAAQPNHVRLLMWKACLLAHLGEHAEARRLLVTAEELGLSANDCYWAATAALELGNRDKVFALLATATKEPVVVTRPFLRISPTWDPLQDDPRFQSLFNEPEKVGPAGTTRDQKAIAVLPFANRSDDRETEYFSDGISEELLNVLGKVPGLQVAGWTSALSLKGKNPSPAEIGEKLGVGHFVDGSVRRAGSRVQIRARLTRTDNGTQIWSDTYEEELKDIFALQDRIARDVAQKLQLQLGDGAPVAKPVNSHAHALVLEGRHYVRLRESSAYLNAERAFKDAITQDPGFALAYAGVAEVYVMRATYQLQDGASSAEVAADIQRGRAAAERSVALDPLLVSGYSLLAYIFMLEGRDADAEAQYQLAVARNPNHAGMFGWRSVFRLTQGRLDDALREIQDAARLDPLWPMHLALNSEILTYAGRFTEAIKQSDRVIALRPDPFVPNLGTRARALYELGRKDEAVATARLVRARLEQTPRRHADACAIWVLRKAGLEAEATAFAAEVLKKLPGPSYQRGFVLGALGRFGEALPYLEATPRVPRRWLYWDSMWDPWRHTEEFNQLIAKLGCRAEYDNGRETLAHLMKEPSTKK